jgi:tRNA-dihydrouridine synthase
VRIPVFGSGDVIEADQVAARLQDAGVAGVLIGRGALRNPWIFAQSARAVSGAAVEPPSRAERGQFLLDYIDLLLRERVGESDGFRHSAPGAESYVPAAGPARGRERWVINKTRALGAWYTKGLEGGAQLRVAINSANSIDGLRDLIRAFFFAPEPAERQASVERGAAGLVQPA